MAEAVIDARGQQCPIPVVKANKALSEMKEPGTLEVHVDNETAVANLLKLAGSKGLQAKSHMKEENHYIVEIEGNGGEGASAEAEGPKRGLGAGISGDTIAVISSDRMGEGNDELGRVLMKGFIYALSQLEKLPETILFYNGGATITCEGSESLADLKSMEEQGVKIFTCGTCLDYYGLKEKLAVGTVTNMYAIVETMASAGRVIRP